MTSSPLDTRIGNRPVLASCQKDEGPFLLEFVAHHLAIGFGAVLIASNDCTDGSDKLLDALQDAGFIGHARASVAPGERPQIKGFARLRAQFPIDQAAWLMMLDTDEFLNIHVGDGQLADLLAAASPETDIIALNWVTFGNRPHLEWEPGMVTERFAFRLPVDHPSNASVKTLTRTPANFQAIHSHHMMRFRPDRPIVVMRADRSTFTLDPRAKLYDHLRVFAQDAVSHEIAQVNHYAIKTYDSFLLRRARGRGGVVLGGSDPERHNDRYFSIRAKARLPDDTIARYHPQTRALLEQMRAHDTVRTCEAEVLATYRARLNALCPEPE